MGIHTGDPVLIAGEYAGMDVYRGARLCKAARCCRASRALRGTMDWSYDLLGSRERLLLQQLAVFAGGWSLEAAEAVCSGDGVERWDVLDGLTELVLQSLVVADEQGGTIRYRYLETVRQYGADLLARSGAADVVRTRHRDWCLAFAERAEEELSGARRGAQHADSFDKVALEHENLRAAVERSLARGDAEAALRLVTALREFWFVRESMAEARTWLEAALRAAGPVTPRLRANALRTAGWLAVFGQGDHTVWCNVARSCWAALVGSRRPRMRPRRR